jgi:gliding motility-associated-like protein
VQKAGGATVDEGMDIVVDGSGNSYTTGYFSGSASFGSTSFSSSGATDIFLVKTNSSGAILWAKKAGGSGSDRGLAIDVDGSGNVYITGYFSGTAAFGSTSISSTGSQDIFIAKYNGAGNLQWVNKAGGNQADRGNGISIDNSGNVAVVGEFKGTATFGSNSLSSQANSIDVFITKLTSSGTFSWAQKGSAKFTDRAVAVGTDNSGNIYAVGLFSDTITFDFATNNTMLNVNFVTKFNSSGAQQWLKIIGGGTFNNITGCAVSGSGNVYVCGDWTGTNLTFFGGSNQQINNQHDNKIFLGKYNSSGGLSWARTHGSGSLFNVRDIDIDNAGNAYYTGNFKCRLDDYSDEYGSATFNSVGFQDIYVAKVSGGTGNFAYARNAGSRYEDVATGVGASTSGKIHFTGSFRAKFYVPTSSNFNSTNLNLWTEVGCTENSPYCGDADYGQYHFMQASGNQDIIFANCFDPNREPYDYYRRGSLSNCSRDTVAPCIQSPGQNCPDTAWACSGLSLLAENNMCAAIAPSVLWKWQNGGFNPNLLPYPVAQSSYKRITQQTVDGCFTLRDTIRVELYGVPDKPFVQDDYIINLDPTPYPLPINICGPDTVILTGSQWGSYEFFWIGTNFDTVYNDSITVWWDGQFNFVVVDSNGCFRSTNVVVEIDEELDSIDLHLAMADSITLCEGDTFFAQLWDSISNPLQEEWCMPSMFEYSVYGFFSCEPQPSWEEAHCHSFYEAIPDTSGWHVLTVAFARWNACDSDTIYVTDSIYVNLLPTPVVAPFPLGISGSNFFCPGETAEQTVIGGSVFSWSGPGVNGSTASVIQAGVEGYYSVVATVYDTNAYGCIGSYTADTTKFIAEKPQPNIIPSSLLLCPYDSIELSVDTTAGTTGFLWEGPNGVIGSDSNSIWVSDPGTYYVVVNDSDSCDLVSNSITIVQYTTPQLIAPGKAYLCEGDSLTISVISNAGSQIQWNPPLSGSGTEVTIYEPGVYSCDITSCGIMTTAIIEVFASYGYAEITGPLIICEDSNALLHANDSMMAYQWSGGFGTWDSVHITTPGTYILTTTDSNGCDHISDPFTIVEILDTTQISLEGYPVFCQDDSIVLFGNSNMTNYHWVPSGDTSQNITVWEEGIYKLVTVDTHGCKGRSEPISVTIPDTTARVLSEGEFEFCEGDSITLRATKGKMDSYLWMPDSITEREITVYESGIYTLTTVDTFGCEAWSKPYEVRVQINDLDKPQGLDTTICMGNLADLFAYTNYGDLHWYERPSPSNLLNIGEHFLTPPIWEQTTFYLQSGFELCVSDTAAITVFIEDCHNARIPNVFTPNGDGANDFFGINLLRATCIDMTIFNRWGIVIFESKSLDKGWDGTVMATGNDAPESTYYYIIKYCRHDGSIGELRGYLSLLRD